MRDGLLRVLRELEETEELARSACRDDLSLRCIAARLEPTPVILCSPYAGDLGANTRYALACMRHSLSRGEAPLAAHILYAGSGCLDDVNPEERELGFQAGLAWGVLAARTVAYVDRGISDGMAREIRAAARVGRPIEVRRLYPTKADAPDIDVQAIIAGQRPPQA